MGNTEVNSKLFLRVAKLPDDLPHIHQIRYLVFQLEQGVDPALEFDQHDRQAEHILAYLNDAPVGTARLRSLDDRTVKIERVAVLKEFRGQGIGQKLMEFLLNQSLHHQAQGRSLTIAINAQESVRAFYEKLGFIAEGDPFSEAGIPHIRMSKRFHP
jgi:predicted GNAT family N-acyltransferase